MQCSEGSLGEVFIRQGISSSDDLTAKTDFFTIAFVYLKQNFDTSHINFSIIISDIMQINKFCS